jgi:hypothetical protein
MQLRFHLDEDTEEHALVGALLQRGLDITTTAQMRLTSSSDDEQLNWASDQKRVLVTHNVADFCGLHQKLLRNHQHHCGILIIEQQRYSIGEVMRRITRLAATLSADQMRDRVEFLSHW